MAEALTYQDGIFIDHTPTAAVVAGQVLQLRDGRAAYAPTAIAAGVKGAVQVKGIIKVLKVVTQTMLPSSEVFWDASANTCNLLHGGDADFFLGTVIDDAAYADTTVLVNLNEKPSYTLSLADGYHSIPVSTAGWPHIYGGGNSVGFKYDLTAEAQKLDALSLRSIATGTPGILSALICVNLNGDDAAHDLNVGLADASHATDADSITSSLFLHMDGNSLNLNIESDNAAAEVAATDTTLDAVVGTPFLVQWDLRSWSGIKCYINGLRVGDGTTGTLVALTLAGVAGPLKLLAHAEKTANDSPGNFTIMNLGFAGHDAVNE
jgi:predicted RecA/RadA family phage recombinase